MNEQESTHLKTPGGIIYRPRGTALQVAVLLASIAGCVLIGFALAGWLGKVSDNTRIALCVPFAVTLFAGYGLWTARLRTIAFRHLGFGLLRSLAMILLRGKKPESLAEIAPTEETLEKMALGAQKASSAFFAVSFPVAIISGLLALGLNSDRGALGQMLQVAAVNLAWGWLLSYIGRRGYLPVMEE